MNNSRSLDIFHYNYDDYGDITVMMILINEKFFVNELLKVWIILVIRDFLIKKETFFKNFFEFSF